jgi:hypothetical protein
MTISPILISLPAGDDGMVDAVLWPEWSTTPGVDFFFISIAGFGEDEDKGEGLGADGIGDEEGEGDGDGEGAGCAGI